MNLSPEKQLEELARCSRDPAYFLDTYWKIIDPIEGLIPFKLFEFQFYVIDEFMRCRFNIVKKPRQMGISNLIAGVCGWVGNFLPYKNVLIISIKEDVAKRFLEKIKTGYKHLPSWMQTRITNGKPKDYGTTLLMEFAIGSRIESIPTSKEAGRSEGVSLLVVDEAAFVEHMDRIWAAAQPTLSTGGMCFLMSTTNGMGNFYHETWVKAMAGQNTFNPIELHYRMYPGRDSAWAAEQLKDLGPMRYAQEVICDFITSGNCVFDTVLLKEMDEEIKNSPPVPLTQRPIRAYFTNSYESDLEYWNAAGQQGPAPTFLSEALVKEGDLQVFGHPQKGYHYCMGVDVARDLTDENDYQALQIRCWETNEIVVEYFGKLTVRQYAALVFYLSYYYNGAFTLIESNGVGWSLIDLLIGMDFPEDNLYTQIRQTRKKREYHEDADTESFGFATTPKSKPIVIQNLQNAYESGKFRQKTQRALGQHFTYQHLGGNKMGALKGYSDDLVMASALTEECIRSFVPSYGAALRV